MPHTLAAVSLLVREYDEAIQFFTIVLRFKLLEDTPRGNGKRWVIVAPQNSSGASLLLAKAANAEQAAHIGNQTGGRVFLFLHVDNFEEYYKHLQAHGVRFTEEPRPEDYGTVVVFLDLYGNKWDLIERK
jgi:catechol 2,3-dioxygenase-like lactoylglutathione lyase family enzyme